MPMHSPRTEVRPGRVLTGTASQAYTLGSRDIVLAAAVGGLGAVWGSHGWQWGSGRAYRRSTGFKLGPGPLLQLFPNLLMPTPNQTWAPWG